jgi:tRNA A-37 threonylcarbamoyl transferase component Bud32
MPPPQSEQRDLEQLAARIADEQPVDWRELEQTDDSSVSGLREIEQLAQGFRHLQVSAVAPKTPTSNRFTFGTLQVLEPIGSGAQGEVWRAYDPLLDMHVALKLRKFESGALSHQFLEEARRLARVRQANIVSVYGAALHNARAGIWSELVRGSPLSELLAEHGEFPAEEVRGIGLDLCHALAAVHRHGLVHGDVKAENVMREVSGRIVLMDFGAAREFELTDGGVVTGTLRYLAPEVLRGAAPSPASDIYALGVLLFHLLSGKFPYAAGELDALLKAQARGERIALKKLKPDAPPDLVRAIEKALDSDPAKRQPTALALAGALAPQAQVPGRRWPALALAALTGGLALLAAGLAWRGAAPAWQAEASFLRLDAQGSTALTDGTSIAIGDRLALQFRSNKAAYIYIFDDDGSGNTGVLFPLAGIEPANPLAAETAYRLPGKRDGKALSWQVSSAADREEFVVIAATQPQAQLEQAIADWQRAGAAAGSTRGALGLAAAPDSTEVASQPLRRVLEQVERAGRDGEVRHWHYTFPHRSAN